MTKSPKNDDYTEEEAARRRDAVLKKMLKTPPKPRKTKQPKPDKPESS